MVECGPRRVVLQALAALVAAFFCVPLAAQNGMMFWNLENFFDYFDDGTSSSDADFSSRGSRRWTKARFTKKCAMVGKTLLWAGERCCPDGEAPDIVGIAEVENAFVLNRLVHSPVLEKASYSYVHYDSPDRRGIDVALLYRRGRVKVLDSRAVHVRDASGKPLQTRDILHVHVEMCGGRSPGGCGADSPEENRFHILVNHHPSKFSGSKSSEAARECAMRALLELCDSIMSVSCDPVVAMGDFNDTPDGPQFGIIDGVLENLAEPLSERGEGSIRYDGRWELIDHFLVGKRQDVDCAGGGGCGQKCVMRIIRPPFLMVQDRAHTGFKPFRTYVGPRYAGGVSDHFPVFLCVSP